jgi:hypothetical protein
LFYSFLPFYKAVNSRLELAAGLKSALLNKTGNVAFKGPSRYIGQPANDILHLSAIVNVADKPKPAFPPFIRHLLDWRKAVALRERKLNAALTRWLATAP